jgi:tetratricopeptide (TPR) repeat protein
MKDDTILIRGIRMIHHKYYGDAISLLESEAIRYRDSFKYYYILAIACLYAGDLGGAQTYFRRSRELKMRDPGTLLGLAFLHLKKGETDKAVELYLEIMEIDINNSQAQKALELIRKKGDPEKLAGWFETGNTTVILPILPRIPIPFTVKFILIIALVLGGIGVYAILALNSVIPSPIKKTIFRVDTDSISLNPSDRANPVVNGGSYRYVLTRDQVLAEFNEVQRLFRSFRDDAARIHINRILASNASPSIKDKASTLAEFAVVPGFDTIKDYFSYSEIIEDPALYQNCHVVWKGMAANLRSLERSTNFDLLVGYNTKTALEGIISVHFDSALQIDPEKPLEVLARIIVSDSKLSLIGVAVHQASSLGRK